MCVRGSICVCVCVECIILYMLLAPAMIKDSRIMCAWVGDGEGRDEVQERIKF